MAKLYRKIQKYKKSYAIFSCNNIDQKLILKDSDVSFKTGEGEWYLAEIDGKLQIKTRSFKFLGPKNPEKGDWSITVSYKSYDWEFCDNNGNPIEDQLEQDHNGVFLKLIDDNKWLKVNSDINKFTDGDKLTAVDYHSNEIYQTAFIIEKEENYFYIKTEDNNGKLWSLVSNDSNNVELRQVTYTSLSSNYDTNLKESLKI